MKCSIDGCDREVRYRKLGWCERCYQRWYKHGRRNGDPRNAKGPTLMRAAERRDLIVELTRQGQTAAAIAEKCGVTRRTVERIRHDYGLIRQPHRRFTADEIAIVEAMLADGASYTEIGRTIGRDPATIGGRWPHRGWTRREACEFARLMRWHGAKVLK